MTDEPKKPELTGDELLQKLFDELPSPNWSKDWTMDKILQIEQKFTHKKRKKRSPKTQS